jgi:hypothetical protein
MKRENYIYILPVAIQVSIFVRCRTSKIGSLSIKSKFCILQSIVVIKSVVATSKICRIII